MENESSVSLKWLLTSGTVDLNPEQVPLSKDTVSFGTQKTRPVVLQIKCHAIQGLFWILPVLNGPHTATDGNVAKGHIENGDHGQRGQPKITAVLKKTAFELTLALPANSNSTTATNACSLSKQPFKHTYTVYESLLSKSLLHFWLG